MKRMVPGIGELEELHCWQLRQRLGLPGPEHPVWALVKWVDTHVCFNEIAQLWQEPVPFDELYFLVGDPDLPIHLDFWTPELCWPRLCHELMSLGWDLALLRLDPDQLAVVKTAHDFTGEDLRWLSLTVATTIETLITQSGDQLTSLEQAASAVEYLTSLLDL